MDSIWQVLRVVAVTAAVVVAAGWVARQAGKRLAPRAQGPHLEVLDSLSLGVQRGVFVVRAGQRALILGVARDSVVLLSETDLQPADDLPGSDLRPSGEPERRDFPQPGPTGRETWADDLLSRRLSLRLAGLRARIGAERGTAPR